MAFKRIYSNNVKKLGFAGMALIFGIFFYLSNTGDITITGYSGDSKCAGTIIEPCFAFLNFTANNDLYIYPTNESTWAFNVTPEYLMKEIIMQRSWGNGWRTVDLSKTYSKDVKYAVKFSKGQNYSLRFVGYKNKISDTVEWTFGKDSLFNNKSLIDPAWNGYNTDDFMPKLISNKADITGGEAVFEYCNPTLNDVPFDFDKIAFSFNKVKGNFNTFEKSIGTKKQITVEKSKWNSVIEEKQVEVPYNGTDKFHTMEYTTETTDNGYFSFYNETEEIVEYSKLSKNVEYLKPNECKNILIKGTWNAGKTISIDWIPEIEVSGVKFKQGKFAWWNTSWTYVRPITITNTSVLLDYQVNILLNSTYIPNLNWSNNGSDVRFTYVDNTTILSYWIENWNNATSPNNASIWVKTNQSNVNMWYGNPTATSQSNIYVTLINGSDDFENSGFGNFTNSGNLAQNTTYKKTGSYSMKVTGAGYVVNRRYIPPTNGTFQYWFYDDGNVGGTQRYIDFSIENGATILYAPTYDQSQGESYFTHNGTYINMGARAAGWHNITIITNYTNWITYFDGVKGAQYLNVNKEVTSIEHSSRTISHWIDDFKIAKTPIPTVSIGAEQTQPTVGITLYLNGTNADRFYELGNYINITACANVTGTTVYINTTHPSFTNPIINGTTCATYLWNNSQVVMNQFNNSAITQNHSANNISGITINSVTDLQGGSMYLKGYGFGNLTVNKTILTSIISNNSNAVKWTNIQLANDTYFTTAATQTGTGVTSLIYQNFSWNDDWYQNITKTKWYYFRTNYELSMWVYFWNYYDNTWVQQLTESNNNDHYILLPIYTNIFGSNYTKPNNPIRIYINYGTKVNVNLDNYFYEGEIIYENTTQNGQYPSNLSISIGTTQVYWLPYMTLQDTYAITNVFKTNTATKNLLFNRGGTNVTYIQAPCNSEANALSWNVSGGSGTQNLNKVDGLLSKSLVFSTENSSNTFNLYLPKSSTVATAPTNITLTGSPYYEANGTLSGGLGGGNTLVGATYKKTMSKAYDGSSILLYGYYSICEFGCGTSGYMTLTLMGTSGAKASCQSSYVSGTYTWIGRGCYVSVSGIRLSEEMWVTVSYSGSGIGPSCGDACSGLAYISSSFSGLNQYNTWNATNITIWQNGTNLNYQYLPELNSSVTLKVNLSSANMNTYLSTCTQDSCPIPYTVKTTKRGNVTISGVNVDYTNSISNITYDVANDGTIDASISGNNIPNNNVTIGTNGLNAMNYYIQSHCVNNSVSVPIVATSATAGTMALSNLVGNFSINPISLNVSAMTHNVTGNNQVPIKYTADNWGILNTYGLSINALTDYNYTFTGWSDSVTNATQTVKLIWSNFSMKFPQTWIDYTEFVPKSITSKNVTPTGQKDSNPIYNFTYLAREQPMNISIWLNESINSCVNITASTTSNKTDGRFVNTTSSNQIVSFNSSSGTKGIWMWVDLQCTYPIARWLNPVWMISSKCSSCV